ncbi:MAG: Gfo/Idh/MocA family oxidoreductase [Sedimentisphaerales bacterium]|nr:Gfo/Idh/MocA family oxidoreductase [Sedimentisphaerales bacterium]
MDKLRTGIIGIGGYGRNVLAQLDRSSQFQVVAVADQDRKLADGVGRRCQAQSYDDYRSLIVQEKLDVLFLALPTYLCGECIQLAAKQKIHVFKEAPLARSLPEASEWIKLLEKAHVQFHIGSARRFAPGYLMAHQMIRQGRLGQIALVRAEYLTDVSEPLDWRGDPLLAGGGVLLEQAYPLIDHILWTLGAPQTVYSLHSYKSGKRLLPPSRTEDTVLMSLTFPDGTLGSLLAGWLAAPPVERLVWHGAEGILEASPQQYRLYNTQGQIAESQTFQVESDWWIGQQIRQFADGLLDPEVKPVGTAREHLVNIAVIESAYLSSRTRMPESLLVYGPNFEIKNV